MSIYILAEAQMAALSSKWQVIRCVTIHDKKLKNTEYFCVISPIPHLRGTAVDKRTWPSKVTFPPAFLTLIRTK